MYRKCVKNEKVPPLKSDTREILQKYSKIPLNYENPIKIEEVLVKISIFDWNFLEKKLKIEEFWAKISIFYWNLLKKLIIFLKNAYFCWKFSPKSQIGINFRNTFFTFQKLNLHTIRGLPPPWTPCRGPLKPSLAKRFPPRKKFLGTLVIANS